MDESERTENEAGAERGQPASEPAGEPTSNAGPSPSGNPNESGAPAPQFGDQDGARRRRRGRRGRGGGGGFGAPRPPRASSPVRWPAAAVQRTPVPSAALRPARGERAVARARRLRAPSGAASARADGLARWRGRSRSRTTGRWPVATASRRGAAVQRGDPPRDCGPAQGRAVARAGRRADRRSALDHSRRYARAETFAASTSRRTGTCGLAR